MFRRFFFVPEEKYCFSFDGIQTKAFILVNS